jgi:hypothetical protein
VLKLAAAGVRWCRTKAPFPTPPPTIQFLGRRSRCPKGRQRLEKLLEVHVLAVLLEQGNDPGRQGAHGQLRDHLQVVRGEGALAPPIQPSEPRVHAAHFWWGDCRGAKRRVWEKEVGRWGSG